MLETKQFRLISLKLKENKYLGDLDLNFNEVDDLDINSPYNTVIIGPNGTGKSYIFSTIISLFRELYIIINDKEKHTRKTLVNGQFSLTYSVNGIQYGYRNMPQQESKLDFSELIVPSGKNWREKKYFIDKNGKRIPPDQCELPEGILASSFMLTDKYVFLSKPEEFPIYKYLGIRGSRSTAGTRTYIRNTINFLANSTEKNIFRNTLPDILNFLGLDSYLFLSYSIKRRETFFTGNIDKDTFINFINKYESELENRRKNETKNIIPWYAFQHYKNLIKDENKLISLITFCNNKSLVIRKNVSTGNYFFEYDLLNDLHNLEEEISLINLLEKLNLLGSPELCFKKKESLPYAYEGASSGESHFISSIIGILATIKENSVILIDEPEISLHPNWQMKYMSFLNKIFEKFKSCHFIIATHSHFLISDLKAESSAIIGLTRENNKILIVNFLKNINTYGWSAEQVLLDVFEVPTTRNYYIAERIGMILKKASIGENVNLDEYRDELLKYRKGLKEEDPLHYTITKIAEKFQWLD